MALPCALAALMLHSAAAFSNPGAAALFRHGQGNAAACRFQTRLRFCRSVQERRVTKVFTYMSVSAWEAMVDRVIDDLNKGMAKYIFVRSVDSETAAELRAAVVVEGRGYKRRSAPAEGSPAPTLEEVVTAVHSAVRGAIVEREGLIAEEDWDKIARGFGQASVIINDEGEVKPANAPPLSLDDIVVQLKRLFPNATPEELEEAARRGMTLEAATDLVMTSAVSLTRLSAKPYAAPRGSRKVAAGPVPQGGQGCLTTARVNGGASAFGIYLDIRAKDFPIRITEIRTASSAGLNFGAGKALSVKVNLCQTGSGRGREMEPSEWKLVGSSESLRLPMASWFDAGCEYGRIPLDSPLDLAVGQCVGLCIHSNDIHGLAIRMARNQAGIDSDMTDDDFGGTEDDEVGGSLKNSFYVGQVTDEDPCLELRCGYTACSSALELPPVSQPVPAAFVGQISYIRTA